MFVTSDIFDIKSMWRAQRIGWRENLVGGVDVHGVEWPGYEAAARFMLEAAKRCGFEEMHYAGYNRPGEWRTRAIAPKSFERLAQGLLSGAADAQSVVFRHERQAAGAEHNVIYFGGAAGSIRQRRGNPGPTPVPGPPWRFHAGFNFPIDGDPIKTASDLLQLSVDILGAEYGYYFVRDDFCGPEGYMCGVTTLLDGSALDGDDAQEVGNWADVVDEALLWSRGGPKMRDLFQVNLLSERHRERPMKGRQDLMKWISALPGRGSVQDIDQGRWLWTLTDAEMVAVRPVLCKAGWLFSCRDRVYRDLPNGGRQDVHI
jgi:hypothetical protein